MGKWIKRAVTALLVLSVLAAAVVYTGIQLAQRRMDRRIDVKVAPVAYRDDAQSLERGRYLFQSRGCTECHGANGAGRVFAEDDNGLKLAGPNITSGPGSVTVNYQPVDWVRTLRHGVKPDGRPALVMPSEDYARWTDTDVAAVVAHVRQLPSARGRGATLELPTIARVLYGFGQIPEAAEQIDHTLPPALPVAVAVSVEHGKYVAGMCIGCHGANLSGGKIPGTPPDWPPAANLTPGEGSAMVRYGGAEPFVAMMRSGKRPDGTAVSAVMPFTALAQMNDTDMRALHLYLKSVPPRSAGGR
jgi:mono/diheme cytochrome c family protein